MLRAYDYHDSKICEKNMLEFYNTEALEFAKQIAREY